MRNFNIKIFADGADKTSILNLYTKPWISGFTTNPTLMRKAGIKDYKSFSLDILSHIKDKPISFEVFSDDLNEMEKQANEIASWADNVYVKIPITNTKSISTTPIIKSLSKAGVKLNVTAVFTLNQTIDAANSLSNTPSIISVFAGRISDAGVDAVPIMKSCLEVCKNTNIELLWASPRRSYDIIDAEQVGCHIITVSHDLLAKIDLFGKDLTEFSLDTIKMFRSDAEKSGFTI